MDVQVHRMALQPAYLIILLLIVVSSKANPVLVKAQNSHFNSLDEQSSQYRLNNELIPNNYDIELTIGKDFIETKKFSGVVKITVGVKTVFTSTNKEIKLHMKNITLDKVEELKLYSTNNGKNLLNNKPKPVPDERFDTLTLKLQDNVMLEKGENYIIRIKYHGSFQADTNGFYLSSYKNQNNESEWLAATNFLPTHARKVFPCFDEPNLKATFTITVIYPQEYRVLSNSEIRVTTYLPKNMTKSIFKETPIIPTYTVALIISKFANLFAFNNIVGVNTVWSRQNLIHSANYAFMIGPRIIEKMNELTGIPYFHSASKLDQIAVPDLVSESMGNWAFPTYRESALLWNPMESTTRNKQTIATNIARELSYVWIGNLVTFEWWSTAWLSEGFACYFGYFITSKIESGWQLEHQFIIEQHQKALANDVISTTEPLSSTQDAILTNEQITSKLDLLTYSKGGAIIRMMKHFTGTRSFIVGVREYLTTNRLGNTKPEDLWKTISRNLDPTNALPTTLTNIMDTWTKQVKFPVVTARIAGQNIQLSQKAYQLYNATMAIDMNKWYIPISYTTSKEKQFNKTAPQTWMEPTNDTNNTIKNVISYDSFWIIINIQNSAYIRVNYDDRLWKALENALKTPSFDDIHVLNRAQIVDDVMNLARASITSYSIALNVTSYLENETDYYPWYSAFEAFEYIRLQFYKEPEASELLDIYLLRLMQSFFVNATYTNTRDNQVNAYKRELAFEWACKLGSKECIEHAMTLYTEYFYFNKGIEPDLRRTVYCTAIRNSNNIEDWSFLRKRLNETHTASEAEILINALGCTRNEELLQRFLNESIDPNSDLRKQHRRAILEAVISGNHGVAISLNFIKSNINHIMEYYGGSDGLSSALLLLSKRLNHWQQIIEFKRFLIQNIKALTGIIHILNTAIENCDANLYWNEAYREMLKNYLRDRVHICTSTSPCTTTTTTIPVSTTEDNNTAPLLLPNLLIIIILKLVTIILF